ncbi:uncharacterized protein CANTADRAFT_4415 [Suhomyces tanzawaensis NRRL Y-17324]|uniref:Autophagy-related protein 33 n=1 Tax=Suhomyces tanzawaensis NRRL Y-17324 TaxID=984487 RepID=A0A1E4SSC7_9ASCO|nr:uncharacterized protein CANTADRAFT_4415 [Suhomyces tanzawaensis NRRL Y-17324]ODV82420.1 hypothetical protein CANTADRAFT_4415 [Suhomyces tanzawaensis NRRL Y-17324]
MVTCIASVKVIGVSSLGLLAGLLSYLAIEVIPSLIRDLTRGYSPSTSFQTHYQQIKVLILGSRAVGLLLGAVSTGLLALAYSYSPPSGKHPYLIYAALGAPTAIAGLYQQGYRHEAKLLQAEEKTLKEQVAPQAAQVVEEVKAQQVTSDGGDGGDDDSLGRSYIHVSDEESSTTTGSTPGSSAAQSPTIHASEPAASIEQEVESALVKKELVHDLRMLRSSYVVGSSVAGVGFLIGVVGLFGENFY